MAFVQQLPNKIYKGKEVPPATIATKSPARDRTGQGLWENCRNVTITWLEFHPWVTSSKFWGLSFFTCNGNHHHLSLAWCLLGCLENQMQGFLKGRAGANPTLLILGRGCFWDTPPPASQAHSLEALKPSLGIPFECGWYSLHPQKPPPDLLAKLNASDCCQKSQIHWCLKMRRGETGSVGTGHTGAWCDPGAAKGPAIPSLWSPLWEEIIPQKSPDKTQKCYFSKI